MDFKLYVFYVISAILLASNCSLALASAYTDSVISAADRLVAVQNNGGTWEWKSPDTNKSNAGENNTIGVTALGLLRAYNLTENESYKNAAKTSADLLYSHSRGVDGFKFQSFDLYFLQEYGDAAGNSSYNSKASAEFNWIKLNVPAYYANGNQSALAQYYTSNNGYNYALWQSASWILAIKNIDPEWANGMAYVLVNDILPNANTSQNFTRTIGWGLSLKALKELGNSSYDSNISELTSNLIQSRNTTTGSWADDPQSTACALIGLAEVANSTVNDIMENASNWLISKQLASKGFGANDTENTETSSEVIQGIYRYIDSWSESIINESVSNITLSVDLTDPDVNIENITNLEIQDAGEIYGAINFSESVNLSGVTDLSSYVTISQNRIEINSSALPELNKPATILLNLNGLGISDPRVLKDGSVCSSCTEISYSGEIFIFSVTGFSVYSTEETPTTYTPHHGGGGSSSDEEEEETATASNTTASTTAEETKKTITPITAAESSKSTPGITGAFMGASRTTLTLIFLILSFLVVVVALRIYSEKRRRFAPKSKDMTLHKFYSPHANKIGTKDDIV